MADSILYGPDGYQKTFTHGALSQVTLQMTTSTQSWVQMEDETVAVRLDNVGRILLMKLNWFPNRRAFETHLPSYDASMPFGVRWTLIGLSSFVDTATMFADLGFSNLSITTLADVYQLFFEHVAPRSRMTSVDDSVANYQLVRKQYTTKNLAQTFMAGPEENLTMHTKRENITIYQSYTHAFTVDNYVITALSLAGLYLEPITGSHYRLGVTSQRPAITLVNGNSISVEAGSVWAEPGASAVDEDGTAVQVTITGDAVNTSQLTGGTPYQLVYTAVSNHGDRNSVVRQVHCIDTTAVTIVLLPHSSGDINPTLDTGDVWVDPGYTATADGSWETITHSQSGTVDVNTPGSYSLVVTASDGTNSATITRTVQIQDPAFFTAAGPFTGHLLSTNFFGTSLTSEQDQLSLGSGYGLEVKFSYFRTTDPQGVIVALLDSSSYSNNFHYEGPDSRAVMAWRIDATSGIVARLNESHPNWGSNRYMGDCRGVTVANQTSYTEVTTRIWDDGSNWKLFIGAGTQHSTKTMAKTGTALYVMPRTSSIDGICVNCVEVNGQVTSSGGWLVNGGSVKDISISALNPAANHSVP